MQQVMKIENLASGFADNTILENISMTLHTSSLICLVGRNGSGKTTLMQTLAGFLKPLSGNVTIDGNDIYSQSPHTRARLISFLESNVSAASLITVEEFIAFGRYPYMGLLAEMSIDDKRMVNEAMQKCGVKDKRNRMFYSLSDGEKQKTCIARAICQDTPFIFMDEPTSHLDFIAKEEVLKLIKEISLASNKCILYSSHDPLASLPFADRFVLTHQKSIREIEKQHLPIALENLRHGD